MRMPRNQDPVHIWFRACDLKVAGDAHLVSGLEMCYYFHCIYHVLLHFLLLLFIIITSIDIIKYCSANFAITLPFDYYVQKYCLLQLLLLSSLSL